MKNLSELLDESFKPISLNMGNGFKKFLTEEDDFSGGDDAGGDAGGDPFAAPADDAGGGDDPFAADAGGGDAGAVGGDAGGGDVAGGDAGGDAGASDGDMAEGDDAEKKSPIDDGSHEDDPDFTMGQPNNNDVTLTDKPAGKMLYDTEKVMNIVAAVIQTLKDDQLVDIETVKNAVELVFNGKKLKDEDLEFTNLKNAIFLIKKIGTKLDIKTRAYLYRKIKEPLIKKRDQIKQDIAMQKGQLQNTRDVLTAMDVK